jgi:hypothetical protein
LRDSPEKAKNQKPGKAIYRKGREGRKGQNKIENLRTRPAIFLFFFLFFPLRPSRPLRWIFPVLVYGFDAGVLGFCSMGFAGV